MVDKWLKSFVELVQEHIQINILHHPIIIITNKLRKVAKNMMYDFVKCSWMNFLQWDVFSVWLICFLCLTWAPQSPSYPIIVVGAWRRKNVQKYVSKQNYPLFSQNLYLLSQYIFFSFLKGDKIYKSPFLGKYTVAGWG